MYAEDFGKKAIAAIGNRAAERDRGAERSMARTVQTFNSLTGKNLTEREGWVFMVLLKLARAEAGNFREDDYIDCAAYAMLAGECASSPDDFVDENIELVGRVA